MATTPKADSVGDMSDTAVQLLVAVAIAMPMAVALWALSRWTRLHRIWDYLGSVLIVILIFGVGFWPNVREDPGAIGWIIFAGVAFGVMGLLNREQFRADVWRFARMKEEEGSPLVSALRMRMRSRRQDELQTPRDDRGLRD